MAVLLAAAALAPSGAPAEAADMKLRVRYASGLARVAESLREVESARGGASEFEGMSEAEVVRTVGRPGHVREAAGTRTLCYGAPETGGFAGLGRVVIGPTGKAVAVFGASPPMLYPKLPENELRKTLSLIDAVCDPTDGNSWDPVPLIRAVNSLLAFPRREVLAILREYVRLTTSHLAPHLRIGAPPRVFTLVQVLFDDPPPETDWSLRLLGDVPVLLLDRRGGTGDASFDFEDLAAYVVAGRLRRRALQPSPRPATILNALQWAQPGEDQGLPRGLEPILQAQIIRMLQGDVIAPTPREFLRLAGEARDAAWHDLRLRLEGLRLAWDRRMNRYVVAQPVPKGDRK